MPTPFCCSLVSISVLMAILNCISFHKFSRQLSVFSPCSSGLISALLALSTVCLFMKVFSPDIVPSSWLGLKHQLTSWLTNLWGERRGYRSARSSLWSSQLNRAIPLLLPIHQTDDHFTVEQGDPFTSAYSPNRWSLHSRTVRSLYFYLFTNRWSFHSWTERALYFCLFTKQMIITQLNRAIPLLLPIHQQMIILQLNRAIPLFLPIHQTDDHFTV